MHQIFVLGTLVVMIWAAEAQEWDSQTKVYDGRYSWLTEVPSDIPAQAVEVNLGRNQIEVIRQNSFSHLSACEGLWLSQNKIHTIEIKAWNGLSSLRVLHLHYNQIEVIRQNSFSHLNACEHLQLNHNKIHSIESGAWDGLDSLRTLYLDNNEIEVIRQNSFSHLSVCEYLDLSGNKIHTIESGAWDGLLSLRKLYLNSNELEILRPGMWSHLNNCTFLDLSDNKIHAIQSGTFQDGLSSLETLWLYGNELTTLQWTVFGKEHPEQLELHLFGNPLVCNSSLCWIKQGEQHGWVT